MIVDITGKVVCQGCKAHFPRSWLKDSRTGAKQVGIFAFCCGKCVFVWNQRDAMIRNQIELLKLAAS